MKKLTLSIFFIMLSISLFAHGEEHVIVINSKADTLVKPNEIDLMIILQSDKGAGKAGIGTAEKTLAKILNDVGVDTKEDFKILDTYSSYNKKGNNVITYRRYNVTLSEMAQVNVIMDKTMTAKIGTVRISNTYNTNTEAYIKNLTKEALLNARKEAEFQAGVLGAKIGKPIYINKGYSSKEKPFNNMMLMSSSASNEELQESSVSIKDIELYVTVQVKFELL